MMNSKTLRYWAPLLLLFSLFAHAGERGALLEGEISPGMSALLERLAERAGSGGEAKSCIPMSDRVDGLYGGYATLEGTLCGGSGTMSVSYHDFAGVRGATASGTMSIGVEFDDPNNPRRMTLIFDGGPVEFLIYGQPYTTRFYDVRLGFRLSYFSVALSSVSGSVSINGQSVSMEQALVPYML